LILQPGVKESPNEVRKAVTLILIPAFSRIFQRGGKEIDVLAVFDGVDRFKPFY